VAEEQPGYGDAHRDTPSTAPWTAPWTAGRVRRLRGYLRASQAELAARLGARQQTVSEWETGTTRPRGMSRRLLHLVAEESGFYSTEEGAEAGAEQDEERSP
jgi:DNA-binding transcriptional regulator YiaG